MSQKNTWSLIKRKNGINGPDGLKSKVGVNGTEGTSDYFQISYAKKDKYGNIIYFNLDDQNNHEYILVLMQI